jgi:pSer/pThr/pTyr-binding forkhead associated (FHA) protein
MALTVVVRSGDATSPVTITFDAPRIVIGRGEGCEVRLPDPSVSHRHASIRQRGQDYVVVDEGSSNGTFVGPVRLSPQAPRVLRPTDTIRVGRIWLEIRVEQAMPTANPQATTRELALALVAGALRAQGEPVFARVRVENGPDQGRELALTDFEHTYVLGRAPDADLTLADSDASRRHVEIMRRGQHVCVKDLGSKNGSELDGKRLEAGKETPWLPSAKLVIGGTSLGLSDPLLAALEELEATPDEAMPPEESIEPPPVTSGAPAPNPLPASTRAAAAPLVSVPENTTGDEPGRPRSHRAVDVIVALLALVVLTVSLLGIAWVLRAE